MSYGAIQIYGINDHDNLMFISMLIPLIAVAIVLLATLNIALVIGFCCLIEAIHDVGLEQVAIIEGSKHNEITNWGVR